MSLSNLYFKCCFEPLSEGQEASVEETCGISSVVDKSCSREDINTCGVSIDELFNTYPIYNPQKGLYRSWGDIEFPWQIGGFTPNLLFSQTSRVLSVNTFYNNLTVRGSLYYPTVSTIGSSVDVIVLYHPTIEVPGITPSLAATNFLEIVIDISQINIKDKIIFSVAYPQDAIPAWLQNNSLINNEFPELLGNYGESYRNFLFGDNLEYAEAALLWVKNNLNAYMSSNGISKTINKVYTFGHSQGAYLVHRLNTMHPVDGVISNAPGPIDLLDRCSLPGEQTANITCNKIGVGLGTTSANPGAYNSRSLKSYLSGTLSPTLFTQALDDVPYQVTRMQTIVQPGLESCVNCAPVEFKYYATGGHGAFVTNPQLQADIREFFNSETNNADFNTEPLIKDLWKVATYRAIVAYPVGSRVLYIEDDGYRVSLYEANQNILAMSWAFDYSKWTKICQVETTIPVGIPSIAELLDRFKLYNLELFDKDWGEYSAEWQEPLKQTSQANCLAQGLSIADFEKCVRNLSTDKWSEARMRRNFFYRQGDMFITYGPCEDTLCLYIVTQDLPATSENLKIYKKFISKTNFWQKFYCVDTDRNKCLEYQRRKEPIEGYEVVEIGSQGHYVEAPISYKIKSKDDLETLDLKSKVKTNPTTLSDREIFNLDHDSYPYTSEC